MNYTKGEWTIKEIPSHGLEIFAEVNMGKDEHGGVLQPIYTVSIRPHLKVCNDGIAELMIAYESWRQFPSVNFEEMQRANAQLIAAAPDLYEALKESNRALSVLLEDISGSMPHLKDTIQAKITAGENALAKAESK